MTMATRAIEMTHAVDPRKQLREMVEPYLDDIEVLGAQVLCVTYIRPEVTKGGIIISSATGHTRDEDIYQGKVHLVAKFGEAAFEPDATHEFRVKPKLWDWVAIRVSDSFQFKLRDAHCRLVVDANIRAILKRPDIVL